MLSKILQIVKSLSKNSENKIEQTGSNNLAIQGINNSSLTITNISDPHYENWKQQLETEEKYYARLNENEVEEKIKISRNISVLKSQISEYEKQVLILAEEISRKNNFKSPRLQKAKELIEAGKIGEAREFYTSKIDDIQNDEAEISNKRNELAEEYLILADLAQTDYYNPNLFEESFRHFKKSLEIYENKDNLFGFAYFLQKYNRFSDSKNYYERILMRFGDDLNLPQKAEVHNNLGNVYANLYDSDQAETHLTKSLELKKILADENPAIYVKDFASTLQNLANIHSIKGEIDKSELKYNEALKIREKLFKEGDDYQKFHVADVLMALGILNSNIAQEQNDAERFTKAIDYLLQALKTYETLNQEKNFIPVHVAICLNHMGLVFQRMRNLKQAQKYAEKAISLFKIIAEADSAYLPKYAGALVTLGAIKSPLMKSSAIEDFHWALKIFKNLEKASPKAFLPDIGIVLNNIAIYYQNCFSNRKKSIEYAIESIIVLTPFLSSKPRLERYTNLSFKVLYDWKLSPDEISNLITRKTKGKFTVIFKKS